MKDHDLAVRTGRIVLYLELNILEVSRIPKRLEVAAQALFVVGVAGAVKMRACKVSLRIRRLPSNPMRSTTRLTLAGRSAGADATTVTTRWQRPRST